MPGSFSVQVRSPFDPRLAEVQAYRLPSELKFPTAVDQIPHAPADGEDVLTVRAQRPRTYVQNESTTA